MLLDFVAGGELSHHRAARRRRPVRTSSARRFCPKALGLFRARDRRRTKRPAGACRRESWDGARGQASARRLIRCLDSRCRCVCFVVSSAFICPQEISPERPKIPSVARHDRCPELATVEHGGHRAGEAGSVPVVEEGDKKSGLPIAHHDT
jgi:hypothetical protein